MQSAEQKMKDMASTAKERIENYKAKVEERTDKATARSPEEKEIAHQNRKVKEAEAKMELHEAKARHAAEKLAAKQSHLYGAGHVHHQPPPPVAGSGGAYYGTQQPVVGQPQQPAIDPVTGAAVPGYPLGGHPTGHKYM